MTRDEYLRAVPSRVDGVRHLDEVAILDLLDRVAALEQRCTPGGHPCGSAEALPLSESQPEAPGGAVPELLPCRCGKDAVLEAITHENGSVLLYSARCSDGCERSSHATSRAAAIEIWNRHLRSHGAGAGEAETREGSEGEPATCATSPVPAPPAEHGPSPAQVKAHEIVSRCQKLDKPWLSSPPPIELEIIALIERAEKAEALAEKAHEDAGHRDVVRDTYANILYDVQRALDMRCLDRPDVVTCSDRIGEEADVARQIKGRMEKAEADLAELRGLIRDLRAAWPGLHDDLAAMIYLKLDGQTLQKIDRTIEELAKAAGLVASAP